MSEQQEIRQLQKQVTALKECVSSLISWLAQSANSPISHAEALELLRKAEVNKR